MRYTGAWRDTAPLGRLRTEKESGDIKRAAPSATTLAACVPSLKSAISYVFTRNRLDSAANPRQGNYLQLTSELAGLGGDVRYAKAQVDAKLYRPINDAVSWGLAFRGGCVRPWGASVLGGFCSLFVRKLQPARRFAF